MRIDYYNQKTKDLLLIKLTVGDLSETFIYYATDVVRDAFTLDTAPIHKFLKIKGLYKTRKVKAINHIIASINEYKRYLETLNGKL